MCICISPDQAADLDVSVPQHLQATLSTLPLGVMGQKHGEQLEKEMQILADEQLDARATVVHVKEDYFLNWLEDIIATGPKGIIISQSSWRPDPELVELPQSLLEKLTTPIALVSYEVGEELREQLSSGHNPSVTLKFEPSGAVYAWGLGSSGQLGLDGIENRTFLQISQNERTGEENAMVDRPCYVATLHEHEVTQLACGMSHTAAVTATGQVFSWGADSLAACRVKVGGKLRLLPGKALQSLKEGDIGTVTSVHDSEGGRDRFEVTWDRTGERTIMPQTEWPGWSRRLELLSQAPSREPHSGVPTKLSHLEGVAKARKVFAGHHHTFVAAEMRYKSIVPSES